MDQDLSITADAGGTPGPANTGPDAVPAAVAGPAAGAGPDARPAAGVGVEGGREQAAALGGQETGTAAAVVYRTPHGWRVGGEDLPDLVSAMVFADLLVSELPSPARPDVAETTSGPGDAETARLKMTIAQLEHALARRVRVEQAIGVLAERHRLQPRQAFEMLRSAARSRGRRVQELADEVVTNVTNPLLPVAEELARPAAAPRARGRSRSA
jgi:hypothetical protein